MKYNSEIRNIIHARVNLKIVRMAPALLISLKSKILD